jgi:uncharacterized protein (TIGR03382 family)
MSIQNRLDRIVALSAVAATGATVGFTQNAEAAIVSSGPVNINIASNIDGVYLNVVTGATGTSGAGVSGWDVNPYSSTSLQFFSATGGGYVGTGSATNNLAPGTAIDGSSGFITVIGTATGFNLNSSDNLVGFRFQNEANGNAVHYGWMRISVAGTLAGQPRAIVAYAYEDQAGVGIQAGAVPTPGTAALLALGAVGMAGRRRK